jgi:hypothetical protein
VGMVTVAVEDATKEVTMTTTHNPNNHPMTSRKARPVPQELLPLTHMPPMVVISNTWPCGIKPMGNNNRPEVRDRLQALLNDLSGIRHNSDCTLLNFRAMMLAYMTDTCSFPDEAYICSSLDSSTLLR